jgi:transcription initiation factor TFIIIB Brf1 subunit/transcription initiation factor TFIIB
MEMRDMATYCKGCPNCGSTQVTEMVERSKPYAARVICAECGILIAKVSGDDWKSVNKIREEE